MPLDTFRRHGLTHHGAPEDRPRQDRTRSDEDGGPNGLVPRRDRQFLKREFDLDNANAIKKALKQGVDKGSLVQKGQSFTIPGVEFQEPEDMKVSITEVTIGDGDVATKGSTVTMRYRGTLDSDGSEFDAGKIDFTLYAGEVIKGWDKGIEGMKVGGKRVLVIPPKLGYGKRGSPPEIPGDATLVFDVELLAVR